MIPKIVLLAFILLEFSNVVTLYFFPGSKRANGVGVFAAWEKSKQFPEVHDLMRYLVYWVAGVKLIFLFLLGLILWYADLNLERLSLVALVLAILTFYWRMFPLARKMDHEWQVQPKNYSLVLGAMILAMIVLFIAIALFGI